MKIRDIIWVLFISMVPLIELRGAIPVGTVLGLPYYLNYAMAVIGNLIPVPFILLLIPYVLDFLEKFKIFRPIVQWVRKKADKNSRKINAQKSVEIAQTSETEDRIVENAQQESIPCGKKQESMPKGAFLGLLLFVMLPIPGTGAWTGALVASLFGFSRLKSFLAIMLGVLGCGVIMCLASYGALGFLKFLL